VAFAVILFLGAFSTFIGQIMAGYQDVARRTLITHFLGTPANIVFAVALISLGFGLAGYLAAQVLSALLVVGMLLVSVWKMTPREARHPVARTAIEMRVVLFSAATFGMAMVDFLLNQSDKIVLGYFLSAGQVGIYATAMALVSFVPVALQSVNQIFSPTIAELYAVGNYSLLHSLYKTLTKWVIVLTLPLALTLIAFSRPLMGIFGGAFEAGASVLIIGTVGQLFNCGVGSVGYLLLMSGHEKQMVKIQTINAALMIAVSLLLVPRLGALGAALAAAFSVTFTNLWSLIEVHRRLRFFPYDSSFVRLVFPMTLTGCVLLLLRFYCQPHSSWRATLIALMVSYAVFLGAFLAFGLKSEDRMLARAAWEKISFGPGRKRAATA
jgi:O-antigen/teichoic acid export membrane protein